MHSGRTENASLCDRGHLVIEFRYRESAPKNLAWREHTFEHLSRENKRGFMRCVGSRPYLLERRDFKG